MKQTTYRKVLSVTLVIGGLLGVLVLQTALLIIMMFITGTSMKDVANYEPGFMTLFFVIYSVIGISCVCTLRYLFRRFSLIRPVSCRVSSFFDRKITIPGLIALGIALQAFSTGILNIVYMFASDTEVFRKYNDLMKNIDGSTTSSILIYTIILAPVFEELIFRGLIMDFSRYGFSVSASIVITAVSFGIFHGNVIQCCYAIPLGLVLGYVRMCRGKLSDSIVLHIIINMSSVTIVPVFVGLVSGMTGKLTAYGLTFLLGTIVIVMWFLKGRELKENRNNTNI